MFLQNGSDSQVSGASVDVVLVSPSTSGNTLIVAVGWGQDDILEPAITDSAGNTYVAAVAKAAVPNSPITELQLFTAQNIVAGPGAITVHVAGTSQFNFLEVSVLEYSGLAAVPPIDATGTTSGVGTAASSGQLVTTCAGDLLLGVITVGGCVERPGAGFVLRSTMSCDGVEEMVTGAAGTYVATATVDSDPWTTLAVAFPGQGCVLFSADGGAGSDGGPGGIVAGDGGVGLPDPLGRGLYAVGCGCGVSPRSELSMGALFLVLAVALRRVRPRAQ